jgi:hypothetical protein
MKIQLNLDVIANLRINSFSVYSNIIAAVHLEYF